VLKPTKPQEQKCFASFFIKTHFLPILRRPIALATLQKQLTTHFKAVQLAAEYAHFNSDLCISKSMLFLPNEMGEKYK